MTCSFISLALIGSFLLYWLTYSVFFNRIQFIYHEYGHAQVAKKYTDKVMMVFPYHEKKKYKKNWAIPIDSYFLSRKEFRKNVCSNLFVGAITFYDSKGEKPLSPEERLEITEGSKKPGRCYIRKSIFELVPFVTAINTLFCLLPVLFELPRIQVTYSLWFGIVFGIVSSVISAKVMAIIAVLSSEGIPSKKEIEKFRKKLESCEKNGIYSGCLSDATKLKYKDEYTKCIELISEKGLQHENNYDAVKKRIEELQKKSDS